MARFSDLGVSSEAVIGKSIDIDELFDKRILIEKVIITNSKYPGKTANGLCMQMQVCLATFNQQPDPQGDYFTKDANGVAIGGRRSCFTGSDILISTIQKAQANLPTINTQRTESGLKPISLFPMDTTIVKVGKCFQFT